MSKILILDDSIELLEVMKYFLVGKGYEVEIISKQEDLHPAIRVFSPDLIIIDIWLQGDDGRKICKDLRNSVETKYLCILIFSASGKDLINYKECGANSFIEKPFGLNEILSKIEATLEECKDYQKI